jgi:hypothetical protein
MKDLTQTERGKTISFFNELDIEIRTMLVTSVSFFNEVAIEMQKLSSETSVSFFNEVAAEMQNYPRKSRFNP